MKTLLTNIAIFLLLFAMFTFTMFTAGYTSEKYGPQDDSLRCINAACERPCAGIKRFKRHEGCR